MSQSKFFKTLQSLQYYSYNIGILWVAARYSLPLTHKLSTLKQQYCVSYQDSYKFVFRHTSYTIKTQALIHLIGIGPWKRFYQNDWALSLNSYSLNDLHISILSLHGQNIVNARYTPWQSNKPCSMERNEWNAHLYVWCLFCVIIVTIWS